MQIKLMFVSVTDKANVTDDALEDDTPHETPAFGEHTQTGVFA